MPQQVMEGERDLTSSSQFEAGEGANRSQRAVDDDDRRRRNGSLAEERDATLAALDALSVALGSISRDQQVLEDKLRSLRRRRQDGAAWRDILADEDPPGAMQVVSRMLASLAKASGTLRKELVDALRQEGVSIPAIARLFGVTHQRVSNLLRRPTDS